jgi:hypothetical protein
MLLNWRILREIEIWNETGYIEALPGSHLPGVAASVPDHAAERKKWAKMLINWQPTTASPSGKGVPELRKGEKKPGEVWCTICMSPLTKAQKLCDVCGAQVDLAA